MQSVEISYSKGKQALDRIMSGTGNPEDQELLMDLFTQTETILDRSSFITASSQEQLILMVNAASDISVQVDVGQVIQVVIMQLARLLVFNSCQVELIENTTPQVWSTISYQCSQHAVTVFDTRLSFHKQKDILHKLDSSPFIHLKLIDKDLSSDIKAIMMANKINEVLILPVKRKNHLTGLVALTRKTGVGNFQQDEIFIGRHLVNQAAISIEVARLLQDAWQRTEELEAVYRASLSLTSHLKLSDVLDSILISSMVIMKDAQIGQIFLIQNNEIHFGASLHRDGSRPRCDHSLRKDDLTEAVLQDGNIVVIPNASDQSPVSHCFQLNQTYGAFLGLPLKINNRILGTMNLAFSHPRSFAESELRALRLLSDQAAIAIENAHLHDTVSQQAFTDSLTILPNRRAFDQRIGEEFKRAKRYYRPFVLLMVDLNGFKSVNDTYGHLIGDRALQMAAKYFSTEIRDTDLVARYGGDEFAIILPETSEEQALIIAERIRAGIGNLPIFVNDGEKVYIGLSYGMAIFSGTVNSVDEIIKLADQALYANKKLQGKE